MTTNEATQVENLLALYAERSERISDGDGGVYVTAYWRSGGQQLFCSTEQAEGWRYRRDQAAFAYAVTDQGYIGSISDWRELGDSQREEYELGAAG